MTAVASQPLPAPPATPGVAPARARAHIPALDGVRGLAALLVLAYHFFYDMRAATALEQGLHAFGRAAWSGVDLFFVLSGFLITGILLDTKEGPRYFRNFYARRAVRIFPLYYGLLAAYFIAAPLAAWALGRGAPARPDQAWYWLYAVNWLCVARGEAPALSHLWSLAIEEQFYLVWPLVVYILPRRGLLALCVACIAGALLLRLALVPGRPAIVAYTATFTRVDTLAAGALVAILARGPGGLERWRRAAIVVGLASAAGLAAVWVSAGTLFHEAPLVLTAGLSCFAGLYAAVVALAAGAEGRAAPRVFSLGPLRAVGKYSYAIYVFHPLVFRWIGSLLPNHGAGLPLIPALGYAAAAAGATIGAAWVSWHLYEKHWLALKRYFE